MTHPYFEGIFFKYPITSSCRSLEIAPLEIVNKKFIHIANIARPNPKKDNISALMSCFTVSDVIDGIIELSWNNPKKNIRTATIIAIPNTIVIFSEESKLLNDILFFNF